MFTIYFVLPLVCAFVAWLSVRGVFYFIFHPVRPVHFLGIKLQGAVLGSKQQIAHYIGAAVASELRNSGEAFIGTMVGGDSLQAVYPMIGTHLDNFLRVKLKEKMPVIAAFIGESTIVKLKEGMMEEITILLPEVITSYSAKMVNQPEISTYITQRITAVADETIINSIPPEVRRMFVIVPLYAAVLGGVVGAIVAGVWYMVSV